MLCAPCAAAGQAPWFGDWRLDLQQSTYDGPPPYRRGGCLITPWQDGLQTICEMVRVRGGVTHLEWAGRFDGHDYPVRGVEEHVTYAYTRVDERSYDVLVKVDGVAAAHSRVTISPDGRTMTTVTKQGDRVTRSVYQRR